MIYAPKNAIDILTIVFPDKRPISKIFDFLEISNTSKEIFL